MDKVTMTHPELKDRRGRPVTASVLPRQAAVLADSGWVPVEPAPEPTPASEATPATPAKKTAAKKPETKE